MRITVMAMAGACAVLTLQAQPLPADILIINARVFTGVVAAPWAEAVAIRGERIEAVGTSAALRPQTGDGTRVIDAAGRLVIPGINDAHAHPTVHPPYTRLEGPPAFESDPSLDEVLDRVKAAAAKAPAGGWLVGQIGGKVLEDARATRAVLDPLTGDRPLLLASWHGHGALVNTAALRRLEISEREPDPPGGFFVRGTDGTLTGLAHEYADYRLRRKFSMLADRDARLQAYRRFAAEAVSLGITSVQAMMTSQPVEQAAPLVIEANLPVRMRLIDFPMIEMGAWRKPAAAKTSDRVTVSGTKWIVDGTPIERLMYLREPYTDMPSSRGRLNFSPADLREFLTRALAAGEQPMFHAVGDGAIDTVLSALRATGNLKWAPLRPRLEHGDMLEPGRFDRVRNMGIVLVQNPSHFMLAPVVHARLGERARRTAIVKTVLTGRVPLALGSDGPMSPFLNMMFAAVNPTNPPQALTIEQSLVAYTRGSAYAEHAEGQKGTLAPGMLADLAMLSQDIFKVPPPALPQTTSVLTLVGGRIVHEAK